LDVTDDERRLEMPLKNNRFLDEILQQEARRKGVSVADLLGASRKPEFLRRLRKRLENEIRLLPNCWSR